MAYQLNAGQVTITEEDAALKALLTATDEAAYSRSSDNEIEALQNALRFALDMLGVGQEWEYAHIVGGFGWPQGYPSPCNEDDTPSHRRRKGIPGASWEPIGRTR